MKGFLLSLPMCKASFCGGFFNRTDVRPHPHTYRSGWMPDGAARLAGWRCLALNCSGVLRQRREGFGGMAGLCAAWLQFFWWGLRSGRGTSPKSGYCAGRMEYVCPGWTGRMDRIKKISSGVLWTAF